MLIGSVLVEQKGIFISYQMAEAIELVDSFDLNTSEGTSAAWSALQELKKKWLNDTLPGTNVKIGDKFAGMQEITLDDIAEISELARKVETYTVENAGAFQNVLITKENGEFSFDFEKLDKIAILARKNNKKIIIDSAVVFGDHYPFKIDNLDKETISKLIGEYTKQLIDRYGDVIERIDVLNSVFEREKISSENKTERFWIKIFGENYAQEVVDIVRNNIDSNNVNIKLCWNEFYLTNSNYEQRKLDFINRVKLINGLDVIGVQDRFMSNENADYIVRSLDEVSNAGREVCITEFSCSASGVDLRNCNTEKINSKIQNIISTVKSYCSKNDRMMRIEGRISDKFDFNYKELRDLGFDVSTTGRRNVGFLESHNNLDSSFDKRSQGEIQIYQQIKEKNRIIKQQKDVQKQMEIPKVKILTNGSNPNSNKGFINSFMLSLIVCCVCVVLFVVIYMILGR